MKPHGFDLSDLSTASLSDSGAAMELCHPATNQVLKGDDDKPITITLAGIDSDIYRKAQRKQLNKRLQAGRGKAPKLTAEELEEEALDVLAQCTLAWSGNFSVRGQKLECNRANARTLYSEMPWIREQADAFMGERANYIRD
jgi:hypothetical protein